MRLSEPLTLTPEPFVLAPAPAPVIPVPEPVILKSKSSKIKNLPTQVEKQKERKLVNDQQLLEQLRSKLKINSIQSKPDPKPEPEPEPEPNPEPDPVLNSDPESPALNQIADDAEPITSAPLLFLPAKIKGTEVHFMVDSGTTNNFLNHNLVRQLDLPTNRLKSPIHVSFADGCTHLIQCYCLVQVPLDPRYHPLLKFYITDITHDAYLGQPWL